MREGVEWAGVRCRSEGGGGVRCRSEGGGWDVGVRVGVGCRSEGGVG